MQERSDDQPLILVTNDDGIHWKGIRLLAEALEDLGRVVVIAPDRNQSAVSHKITLHEPLRAVTIDEHHIAVDGTPVDCVYLGVHELLDRRPDLVVSGINAGPNLGWDVHYSGTVGGAVEGTMLGLSAFAISLIDRAGDYQHAASFARSLAASILARGGLPQGVTLNVNVPPGGGRGARWTTLGRRRYSHSVHRREDPRGGAYYWIGGAPAEEPERPETDCEAIKDGYIAVTPLMADMTCYRSLEGSLQTMSGEDWPIDPPVDQRSRG